MKLYTLKIIILKILLFNRKLVFCFEKDNLPLKNNVTFIPDDTKLVKPNCSYIEIDGKEPLTRRFVYEIDSAQLNKLAFPNRIDRIFFNDHIIKFGDNVKFPVLNIGFITIYTSKFYSPILISIYGDSKFYYYSFDSKSSRWNDHEIHTDIRFTRHVDDNGNTFYLDTIYDASPPLITNSFGNNPAQKYTYQHESYIDTIMFKNIEIYLRNNNIFNPQNQPTSKPMMPLAQQSPSTFNFNQPITNTSSNQTFDSQPTRRFQFNVNQSIREKLIYPNKLDKILFNDYSIVFDNNTILPNRYVQFITIYTCKHNNPILMYMQCKSRYYYYSVDSKTNKWSNHIIRYDTGLSQYKDKNDVYFYKISFNYVSPQLEKYEDRELVKSLCKPAKCVHVNPNKDSNIQIYMKSSNISMESNTESPKKTQQFTITNDTIVAKDLKVESPNNSNQAKNRHDNRNTSVVNASNLITSPLSFTYTNTNNILTREFIYKICGSDRTILKYPNKINKIQFNNLTIQFDENVKLPSVNVDYLSMYTCVHNNPILMYMYGESNYYYYSLNLRTNKWSNYRINFDSGLAEYIDTNATYFYKISLDHPSSTVDRFEDKELVAELCKKGKCMYRNIDTYNDVKIYMNSKNIPQIANNQSPVNSQPNKNTNVSNKSGLSFNIISQPLIISSPNDNCEPIPTNSYDYQVSDSMRQKLFYPNKLNKIQFTNYTFVFDENVKLPSFYVDKIYILTCKHNNPILIYMQCKSLYYFYSFDSKSNKWNNHRVRYDTGLTEFIDTNGSYYYIISRPIYDDSVNERFEDEEIAKTVCKEGKCIKYNVNRHKNIQIFVSTPSTPQVTNNVPSKKPQLTTNGSVNNKIPSTSNKANKPAVTGSSAHISDSLPTKRFDYDIDVTNRSTLRHPNKLDKINFNDYIIQFDENVKMPVATIDHVFIYTCVHNNPFLMLMYGDSKFYYYSLDSKTNKWSNHIIRYDERFTRYIDPNGSYYYTISQSNSSAPTSRRYEDKELVKFMCKREKCAMVDVSKDKNIEIFTK